MEISQPNKSQNDHNNTLSEKKGTKAVTGVVPYQKVICNI